MTLIYVFLKGMLIGLSIAAPVGPIGFLCIKTTLNHGRAAGLATGAGAACADMVYAIVGAFGLVMIASFLNDYSRVLRIVGGVFLIDLGAKTMFAKPASQAADIKTGAKLIKDFVTTFFLTLTNPATIFSFMAIFAGLGLGSTQDHLQAGIMVAGVFSGSLLWWFCISLAISKMKSRITDKVLQRINIVAGVVIGLFGVFALLSIL